MRVLLSRWSRAVMLCWVAVWWSGAVGLGQVHAQGAGGVDTTGSSERRSLVAETAAGRAVRAQERGRHAVAADWFRTAYRYVANTRWLLAAAREWEKAGDNARAATLARAVTEVHAEAEERAAAEALLERHREQLVAVVVQCAGCRLMLDGELLSRPRFFVRPGKDHEVQAQRPDGHWRRSFRGEAGEEVVLPFEPAAPPPEVEPEPAEVAAAGALAEPAVATAGAQAHPAPSATGDADVESEPFPGAAGMPPAVGFVALGLTAALIAGTTVYGVQTLDHVERYEAAAADARACSAGDCSEVQTRAERLLNDGRSREVLLTVALLTSGTVALATGLICGLLVDWAGGEDKDEATGQGDDSTGMLPLRLGVSPGGQFILGGAF